MQKIVRVIEGLMAIEGTTRGVRKANGTKGDIAKTSITSCGKELFLSVKNMLKTSSCVYKSLLDAFQYRGGKKKIYSFFQRFSEKKTLKI